MHAGYRSIKDLPATFFTVEAWRVKDKAGRAQCNGSVSQWTQIPAGKVATAGSNRSSGGEVPRKEWSAFGLALSHVLQRCIDADLVRGEGFTVDASIVKADASHQRHREEDDDWGNGRAVREYIEALETDNAPAGKSTRKISPTDPAAGYTTAPGGPAFYACSSNYLIDTGYGIIMDVEPGTANRTPEVETTKTMVERVEESFGIKPLSPAKYRVFQHYRPVPVLHG